MCQVTFANERGRTLCTITVPKGTTWRRALRFMSAEPELRTVRCVLYGTLKPIDLEDTVQGDCCVVVNVDSRSFVTIAIAPRKGRKVLTVNSKQPLKDALLPHVNALSSSEELAPMWDPTARAYRDPMSIDTLVEDMRKPVRVLARLRKLSIDSIQDIEEKWPYPIERIKQIGDGMWHVQSHGAYGHIVFRGTHHPIESPATRSHHVRL